MRLNKQFYLPILIALLTVTGPIQAVTAAEVMTADDVKTDKKLRLPNDGRSDLQELIQRVVTGDTGDGQPTEPEPDEPETPEVAQAEQPEETDPPVEQPTVAKADSKPASSAKAPRGITTNTNGTSTWTFDSDTGLLVFGAGQLAQRIDQNLVAADLVATQVKKIQFEANVTVDPNVTYLFANLGQLSEFIDLQNFDTSNVTSMAYWFYNSKGLTNPDFSLLNTSNVTNMSYMFYGTLATSLDLSAWNVDKVTTFAYMFSGATALTTLNLSSWGAHRTATNVNMSYMLDATSALTNLVLTNFKTTNVINMSVMFRSTGLTNLDLSDWDVTKVTNFSNMFTGVMSKLETLNLSGWGLNRTATDVNMSYMFSNNGGLTNLNLTNFKTTNVTTMAYMFQLSALTSLDLSDWDVTKVTSFNYMFQSATKLTTLHLSNWGVNRTARNVSMDYMFDATSALTSLTLANFKTTNVISMNYMFRGIVLTNLALSDWDVTQVTMFSHMFTNASKLTDLDLSNWGANRTASTVGMSYMFSGTSALTNLTLTNFQTTNVTNMSYMFQYTGLTELDLHTWNVAKVTTFANMFQKAKITALNLSSWRNNDSSVTTSMAYMFDGTSTLTTLNLSNFKTASVTNMSYTFRATGLTELDLSNWDVNKVTSFTYMFYGADKLITLDVSNWGDNRSAASVVMDYMFAYTSALTSLNLTNFKTDNVTTMAYMFSATALTTLDLHSWNVDTVLTFQGMFLSAKFTTLDLSNWGENRSANNVIMSSMFQNTPNLKNLTLTNFKTTNVINMTQMFYVTSLEKLDLHNWDVNQVTSFQVMFYDASQLTDLDLSGWGSERSATDVKMNGMFNRTSKLNNLTLVDFKTTNVIDMAEMFSNTHLTDLNINKWDVSQVTTFRHMFYNAGQLTNLNLSGWGQERNATNVSMESMFQNTASLKSVNFANFNTSNVSTMKNMFAYSGVVTLDLSSWQTNSLQSCETMFSNTNHLWKITLGKNTMFLADPSFRVAPATKTIFSDNGQNYKTTAASWQEVGSGTVHNPKGTLVSTTDMWNSEATRPVTYVWAQAPTIDAASNIVFGTLNASDFGGGKLPIATNMSTGKLDLINLEAAITYDITVAQTSDWEANGTTDKITRHDLKLMYGDDELSDHATTFWQGQSENSQKSVSLNHNPDKSFRLSLNPATIIKSSLLDKQLQSTLTWSFNDTP
ncbi:MAG: BspA family leucine-rich repeat surface protein [Leuconostoc pseudomesenteroides]|uniref:BspA family leucine-rich repeat surface protein n=1 Tax=Leuconostoc pseudomesenteroides TaxID=33968 RepID=UPI0039E95B54